MKSYELFELLVKYLRENLPTEKEAEWTLDMFEKNVGELHYGLRVSFDYSHNILTYYEGDDADKFIARIEKEVEFYKQEP